MKKFYIIALSCLGALSANAQLIFSENFGEPEVASQPVAGYDGFQYESPINYSGTATVGNENPGTGYPGSSGAGNIYFAPSTTQNFTISGINTSGFGTEEITLFFAYYKNTASTNGEKLKLEVSTNGTDFTELDYIRYTDSGWERIQLSNIIPSSPTLSIRFTQNSAIASRIDDVILRTEYGCPLIFSTSYVICNQSTSGADTFTAYLPYYGGGSQSYGIIASQGTISGDNPSTVESGVIQITNVPENEDISIAISSENCGYSLYSVGPQCKPEQALPFYESFDYNAGSSLTTHPSWAESTNGQNLIVREGSLTYPGMQSDYNSLKLVNGKDAFMTFGAITTGAIYTSFMLQVEDMSNLQANLENRLIAGLSEAGNFAKLNVRFYAQKNGNQFKVGVSPNSSDVTYSAESFDVGETLFVIFGYDYATNELVAWINPDLDTLDETTEPTIAVTAPAVPASIGGLALYQNGITVNLDEMKVATSISVVTTSILATQQNIAGGFTMYPNPLSGGELTIQTKNNLKKDVAIYDMMGKQVVTATTEGSSINASLSPGVYMVKVTEEGTTTTKKLIVN